jgi:hypothetical protein
MPMPTALQHVAWEPCLLEPCPDRVLQSHARRKQGIPYPSLRYFAPVPWLARVLIDLRPEYGFLIHLDQDVVDLIVWVVSQENSCCYCYAAVRVLLWGQGMSKARIQRIEQDLTRADLPPRTVAAIAFGRSQTRLSGGVRLPLREGNTCRSEFTSSGHRAPGPQRSEAPLRRASAARISTQTITSGSQQPLPFSRHAVGRTDRPC